MYRYLSSNPAQLAFLTTRKQSVKKWPLYCNLHRGHPPPFSTQVLLRLFLGLLWLWHFLYSVGPYTVSSLYIYTFVVSRAFMADVTIEAGDADYSRAPGLTSGLQGSVNVHHGLSIVGATVTVHQFFCILHFCHICSLCRVELVVQCPARGRLKCYYAFFLVCCGCETFYIVSVHIQCQASIYKLSLCRRHSCRVLLAKQETLTPPGHLVSPLICRGPWMSTVVSLLLVSQWQCISSFVFYIMECLIYI